MKVILFGGSGLVGTSILRNLLDKTEITKVQVVLRRSLGLNHEKLDELIQTDLSPQFIKNLDIEANIVVCALGTTIAQAGSKQNFKAVDFDLSYATAELSKKLQAKFILVSAAGADSNSFIFYNRIKGQLEEAVMRLKLNSLVIYRPSLLIGERSEKRTAERLGVAAYKVLKPILPKSLRSYLGTEVEVLAKHVVENIIQGETEEKILNPSLIRL
ncbi:MAG: hypothetical protein CME65_05620 [Halobacteriovoraceae bacterium]|nr:hypothetical protein [Halobacteriovoraceae bacterium]|tara:strand:- start:1061 stop:1705 length:645 start_codon:yes stop_codon:yes gene_type:complete